MGTPFLSEIRIMSFNFAPKGWAQCNGQTMAINQNQALFSLLGTTYGGNGQTTFALPNLQGQVPIHMGAGFTEGQIGGEYNHTLTISELAGHNHAMSAKNANADLNVGGTTPAGANKALAEGVAAKQGGGTNPVSMYGTGGASIAFYSGAISNAGGSQPHPNMQPFLTLNFCIALQGAFPSRN
jgi:microcystin-dependent protein